MECPTKTTGGDWKAVLSVKRIDVDKRLTDFDNPPAMPNSIRQRRNLKTTNVLCRSGRRCLDSSHSNRSIHQRPKQDRLLAESAVRISTLVLVLSGWLSFWQTDLDAQTVRQEGRLLNPLRQTSADEVDDSAPQASPIPTHLTGQQGNVDPRQPAQQESENDSLKSLDEQPSIPPVPMTDADLEELPLGRRRLPGEEAGSAFDGYHQQGQFLEGGPPGIQTMLPDPPPGGRTITINPLAIPQGVANWFMAGPESRQPLGFPFTVLPDRVYDRIPRVRFDFSLPHQRATGAGQPLQTRSWRNRPLYAEFFSGGYFAGSQREGLGDVGGANFIGGRLGWDMNHYVGTELRVGWAESSLPDIQRTLKSRYLDVHWLYYPWGDARFRPYTKIGMGTAEFSTVDELQRSLESTAFNLPIGVGFKYYVRHWLTMRLDFEDNITFGSGLYSSSNNLSVTGSLEMRFGGRRPSYFPFNSSRAFF